MTPTGRKPDEGERYRAILETAARLICERGYEGTSMQEIAAACRMTKAGLYHHIQNKEQLLFAIMNYGMDVFEEQVLAPVQAVADPVERLRQCMRQNIHLVTSGRSKEVIIILHEHATLTGEAREYIDRRKKRYVRFLEDAFAEANRLGRLRGVVDPTVAAFSFLGMILWVYKWFKPDGRLTEEQIADGMVELLFPSAASAVSAPAPSAEDAPALRMVPRAASGSSSGSGGEPQ
ncbi:TetR/AcrR family transcriptional regulator [Corallococcus exiguus]|uniref:TetR family transcriptional regulator n=1 Tax=Corallococcus exiguus TaxID=83462 RepID=A0A7X4YIV0_9BACT|nr:MULTISPECIES: TetR/AcrR family transcriptional regulator [Corallococcus]NBC46220.1 TetR family transcriptional regulator [Corallococcus exiguus]NNC16497.1 TetR/AcrR family transcriptional regulator [Corallococcus exiguus]NRD52928.1 TetR/AcrR family transcriptional regulator [Corallococcus exiguus]RKI15146.1 TetR/AcrR family transcriptional regulator [Corallococcus sp. AB030]RUO93051.1 TetR/AcrR family transcriptional regulator [Corallococcus sp. AB018]